MVRLVLLSFTLFLLLFGVSVYAQPVKIVDFYPNQIIVESQDYIDKYFDWQFTEINNTNWLANFTINQQLWDAIKNCRSLPLLERPACWVNLKNTYFSDFDAVKLGINLLNLTNYPTENLTKNIRFKNFQFDLVYGKGSFNIIFDNGFKINERARFGFGSTNISTTTTQPFYSSQRAICKDSAGTLHITWRYSSNTIGYANSSDGTTWNVNLTAVNSTGNKNPPSISCDGANITVAYEDTTNDDIIVYSSIDSGVSFVQLVSPITSSVDAYVNIERRGEKIYIVYRDNSGDKLINFINSSDAGTTWGSIMTLFTPASGWDMNSVSLAVNGSGTDNDRLYVIASYGSSLGGGDDGLFKNSTDDGATWGPSSTAIDVGWGDAHPVSITYKDNNKLYASGSYKASGGFLEDLIAGSLSSNGGRSWTSQSNLPIDTTTEEVGNPIITVDYKGNPWVFWEQNETNAKFDIVYRSYNGTAWNASVIYITNNNLGNTYVNTPYKNYGDNKIHYIWRNGTTSPFQIMYDFIILKPTYSLNSTNSTLRGTPINHSLYWESDGLSGYIFSWNSSGTWTNSSFVSFSGTANTSWNVSSTNSTKGIVVAWCFYANATSNIWSGNSCNNPFTYTTTDDFPKFSSNITSYPSIYNWGINSTFNINWTDDIGISKVFIESNYSGSAVNYTPTQYGSVYNITLVLPAGSHYWKSYANDTYNQWNTSGKYEFAINKNNTVKITLYLNGTASDASYSQTIANITATINTSYNVLLKLDMNATGYGVNFQNVTAKRIENITNTSNLAVAIYNVTAHFDSDENYSAVFKTNYLTVTDSNTPSYSNIIISPTSPVEYSKDAVYKFNITWTDNVAIDKVIFEFNGTNSTITTNVSSVYYTNNTDLPASAYNYRWFANDTSNNWGSTVSYNYNVTNATNTMHINFTYGGNTYNDSDISVSSDTTVRAECWSDFGLCQLFYDNNSVSSPHTATHGGGTHTYIANSTGNANYSANSTSQTVTSTAVVITLQGGSQPSLLNVDFNPAEINITAPPGSEKIFNITINNYEKTEVIVKLKLKGNSPSSAEIINNKSYWVISPFESTVIQVRAVFPNVLVDRDFIVEATASMGTVIRTNDILVYLTTIEPLDIGNPCQQNIDCISSNCENLVCAPPKEKPSYSTYYIIGGIALVGIGIYILKKQKKK